MDANKNACVIEKVLVPLQFDFYAIALATCRLRLNLRLNSVEDECRANVVIEASRPGNSAFVQGGPGQELVLEVFFRMEKLGRCGIV